MTRTERPRRHFVDFSVPRQLWEGVGCAGMAGAVSGLALGAGLWLYLATATVAAIGGLPAGTQHRTLRGALLRTAVGGTVWAAFVLITALGIGAASSLPTPDPVVYLVLTAVPATFAGWLAWTWSHRSAGSARPALSS